MKKSDSIEGPMAVPPLDKNRREMILTVVQEVVPAMQAVYLFGSHAGGGVHPESDLDIAILAAAPLPAEIRRRVQEDLSVELRSDVDVVDLRSASTVMRTQVVTKGVVLFEREPTLRHQFEMQTLSAYALLNEERAKILEHVHRRGRIYGR